MRRHLREHRVRLADLVAQHDSRGNGQLSARDLGRLVRSLLGSVSDADLAFFQVRIPSVNVT